MRRLPILMFLIIGLGLIAYVSPIAAIGAYLLLCFAIWDD